MTDWEKQVQNNIEKNNEAIKYNNEVSNIILHTTWKIQNRHRNIMDMVSSIKGS